MKPKIAPKQLIADGQELTALHFVSVHRSSVATVSGDLVGTFDGLLAIQSLNSDNGWTHISFWASGEHFNLARQRFIGELGITGVLAEGPAAPLLQRKKPWYKSVKPTTVVLSTAALIGALEVITNRYERLFAAPDAALRLDQREYVLTQGERISTEATIENLMAVADLREISAEAFVRSDKSRSPLNVTDPRLPAIQAAKERTFRVDGLAPPPGDYELMVEVKARAGYFRWAPRSYVHSANLRVYPLVPSGVLSVTKQTPTSAELTATVRTGSAIKGTGTCEIFFAPGPEFRYQSLYTDDPTEFEPLRANSGDWMPVITWRPGVVTEKTEFHRRFNLQANTAVDWTQIINRAKIACSRE